MAPSLDLKLINNSKGKKCINKKIRMILFPFIVLLIINVLLLHNSDAFNIVFEYRGKVVHLCLVSRVTPNQTKPIDIFDEII